MQYLFICENCQKQSSLKQKMSADHSGKGLACLNCHKKKLTRVYTIVSIKKRRKPYKLGTSNPFANV